MTGESSSTSSSSTSSSSTDGGGAGARSGLDMTVAEIGEGLGRYLSELWGEPVAVGDLRQASAGARRRNVLFTATSAERGSDHLVATIVPTPDLQIVPISVEAGNLRLAHGAGVPTPEVVADTEDARWVGGPFFVSTLVEGKSVPRRVLRLVAADPSLGGRLARQCGRALATLHAVDVAAAPDGIEGPPPASTPVRLSLETQREQIDELLQPSPTFELGHRWLSETAPSDDRVTIVHGDFRNGNLIVGPDGLRAVLDWEGSRLGAPMADLVWSSVRMWRFGNDHLPVGGFAAVADLRAGYEEAGGRWDDDAYRWWTVSATLRWGLGLANQARQHLDREYPSIVMAASGRRVAEMEYDLLMLLADAYP
ncbi:MAG: phosphotransferase family protein [Acidimicrobiales bacterium]